MITKSLERRHDTHKFLVDKREPIYSDIIKFMFELVPNSKNRNNAKKDSKALLDITGKLSLWASDDVLRSWITLIDASQNSPIDINKLKTAVESLLLSMRNDIGQSRSLLNEGEILKLLGNSLKEE